MVQILVRKLDVRNRTCGSFNVEGPLKTLDEVSKKIPQGAYTTFRTFNHSQVIHMQDHFSRLEETVKLSQSNVQIDQSLIRENLRSLVNESGTGDLRVRITLDLEYEPGNIYFSIENLKPLLFSLYNSDAAVITVKMKRDNPKAKLTNFLKSAEGARINLSENINEILMVDERGIILEGLSSNFFAVYDGEIWTEEENVLSGITRTLVLEEAGKLGIKINLQGINVDQINQLQEAFITSTSRCVLPIREIDRALIGRGKPGPITMDLMEKYQMHLNAELEEI